MLTGKKIGILGAAKSGIAAALKAKELGAEVFLSEFNPIEQVANVKSFNTKIDCEFGGHSDKILESDLIVISPGIPSTAKIVKMIEEKGIELISEIEFGFRIMNKKSKIIAVTGSNGKSTTVSLIQHIFSCLGKNSILAGNIGVPFTSFPIEKKVYDAVILELSSFQLERVKEFTAEVSCVLNITPDHLNRYNNFSHYAETKFNIFMNQTSQHVAVLNLDDEEIISRQGLVSGTKRYFSKNDANEIFYDENNIYWNGREIPLKHFKIKGPHNSQNIMASLLAIDKYNFPLEEVLEAISSFDSLSHRLEKIGTINDVLFVNDSKATNTDSVKYALQTFESKINIILGGSDKGEDFSVLIPYFKNVKTICLIGETRNKMKAAFSHYGDKIIECETLEVAIKSAYQNSEKDEVVLLSPACASYDMFNNFEHRGNEFSKIVNNLKRVVEDEQ